MIKREYINNLETGHIELHIEKQEYLELTQEQKVLLRKYYTWSKFANAWVSKATKNKYFAIELAKKFGFEDEIKVGERITYQEELERKAKKAERRAERYEQYSRSAVEKASNLQADWNEKSKDWSFVTQPNVNSSGGRRFTNYRNKIINRYEKGFEEYRKSEYFSKKAETARNTASMKQLTNKIYLNNRINECESNLRKMKRILLQVEDSEREHSILENMDFEMDKLAYFKNQLDELGGILYSQENIKPGYHVRIDRSWAKVLKVNKKTIDTIIIQGGAIGFRVRIQYAEIQDIKIPQNWEEPTNIIKNPFNIGDILTFNNIGGTRIISAFQVIKTTSKTISIREIKVDKKPVLNNFINDEIKRKTIKKDRSGNIVVNYNNYYLHRYN